MTAAVELDGIYTTRQCRYGRMKYLTSDIGVGACLTMWGEYFEGEVALMRRLLRSGDTVVSAGGNIGVHIIPLSRIVGPAGRVITFEPQDLIRDVLVENIKTNDCRNVTWFSEGLGAEIGTATLPVIDYAAPNNFGGMELLENASEGYIEGGGIKVNIIPLDDLELPACHMIMLDVEGYELQALQGAAETIERCRPYLYIEIDRDYCREEVLRYVKDELRYEVLFHTPQAFNPDNFDKAAFNPWGDIRSIMCLGVPS